ncbi:MAG: serine/threonine-protein kinase [Polyangiaceae bacterium]
MSQPSHTQKLGAGGTIIQAPASEKFAGKFGPGEVVAGIYRVERRIGEGGMGIVLAARHLPSGQVMALKLLHQEAASADGAVARFWREARAVSRLQHPNVVRIFDVGTLADDTPYMAMELLEGETLAARIDRIGKLPVDEALGYLWQACAAVEAAHAIGVVHRDLKPDNMFLTRSPQGEVLKVLDFGISKAMAATASDDKQNLTRTTDVFGSPTYMSPEQLKASRDVDARADVWSLAVVLHEMLAGKPPFDGRTVAEIFGAILYMPPPPLTSLRPDVPRAIESAVLRALEKDRDKRLPNVPSLRAAIEGREPLAKALADAPAPAPRKGAAVWIVAVVLVVIVAVVTFVIVGRVR